MSRVDGTKDGLMRRLHRVGVLQEGKVQLEDNAVRDYKQLATLGKQGRGD